MTTKHDIDENADAWEVHLVYSLTNESPSDECLYVAAPDRETAIAEARRVSSSNPPTVGPVYNEGDRMPVQTCDNWPMETGDQERPTSD